MALQVYTVPSSSVEINPIVTESLVEYPRDKRALSLYHSILVGAKSLEQLYVIELPTVPMTALEVIVIPMIKSINYNKERGESIPLVACPCENY